MEKIAIASIEWIVYTIWY